MVFEQTSSLLMELRRLSTFIIFSKQYINVSWWLSWQGLRFKLLLLYSCSLSYSIIIIIILWSVLVGYIYISRQYWWSIILKDHGHFFPWMSSLLAVYYTHMHWDLIFDVVHRKWLLDLFYLSINNFLSNMFYFNLWVSNRYLIKK